MTTIAAPPWDDTRTAVGKEAARLSALLRTASHPDAIALGQWSVAELATHVAQALETITRFVKNPSPALVADIWSLGDKTMSMVAEDPVRDLKALADRIDAGAAALLEAVGPECVDATRPWIIGGTETRPSHLTCHALNELVVHAYDIAKAEGQAWKVDQAHAAMIIAGFLIPVLQKLPPAAMVDEKKAAGVKATYEVRLRGTKPPARVILRIAGGAMSVEDVAGQRIDCHTSADPAALLLVIWGRKSQWPAIAKGQLTAWGRKPWLGFKLKPMLRNP